MKLIIEWELIPFRFTARSFDGDDGPVDEIIDRLTVIEETVNEIREKQIVNMALQTKQVLELFPKLVEALEEAQTELTAELDKLKLGADLTPEQEVAWNRANEIANALKGIVPNVDPDNPPIDPPVITPIPPADPNAPIPEARRKSGAGGAGSGTSYGKGK